MKRRYPHHTITMHPDLHDLLERYRNIRGVGRSTAITELLFYFLDKKACPANPMQIEQALGELQKSDVPRRLA